MATRFSRKRNATTSAIPVWMPRSGENAIKMPSPKARAMRCGVSSIWRRIWTTRRSPSLMPPRWDPAAGAPGPEVLVRLGRRRRSASPNFMDSARRAVRELAHRGHGQVPHDRDVLEPVERVRRHRQQQLVVLAAVQGEREAVVPAFLLELRAAQGSTGRAAASTQAETSLSSHSVRRSPERPSDRSMAACTMSCSASARPKASGGVGSSWARMHESSGRAPPPVQVPRRRGLPSSSRRAPAGGSGGRPRPAPSVPVTTTRSPACAPRGAGGGRRGRGASRR